MKKNLLTLSAFVLPLAMASTVLASSVEQTKGSYVDKFRQLDEALPTPNVYRSAAGAPAENYWQQRVDYDIDVTLDEQKRRLTGSQTIEYKNNSPHTLKYLWLQLDQNIFKNDSIAETTQTFKSTLQNEPDAKPAKLSLGDLRRQQFMNDNELGYTISNVKDEDGKALRVTVVDTLMRIDLNTPLKPGKDVEFSMDFAFNLVEEDAVGARAGYEHFEEDGNDIFLVAQWFPRLAAYTDYEAWTNKPFLGSGEFTLEFGDYDVEITVPADHIVSATGKLDNPSSVLTSTQRKRLEQAEDAKRPVFIVTEEEALEVAAIQSISQQVINEKSWQTRPFRAPHHTASSAALVGGGSQPQPGEISLAHHGVLFLDELPEFERKVLDVLREPLESGEVTISRALHKQTYPAKFQLVAAMNPSPTGFYNDRRSTPEQVLRYLNRLSGPFLDRIDIQIEVTRLPRGSWSNSNNKGETSEEIRKRVQQCASVQQQRQGKANAHLSSAEIRKYCNLTPDDNEFLELAGQILNPVDLSLARK